MSKQSKQSREERNKAELNDELGRSAQTPPEPETNANLPSSNAHTAGKSQQSGKTGRRAHALHKTAGASADTGEGEHAAGTADKTETAEGTGGLRSGRARARQDAARLVRITQGKLGASSASRSHRWSQHIQGSEMNGARNPLSPRQKFQAPSSDGGSNAGASASGSSGQTTGDDVAGARAAGVTVMPLFPLKNVVLFPGMMLPLHIFEQRYREMINLCIEAESQFGVVLIEEGDEVGGEATPHRIGTAARITKVTRQEDGRINIVAVGTQRFEVIELDHSKPYLQATVKPLPVVNGSTRLASNLVQQLLPRIFEYVELLEKATKQKLPINRLPEDPATLAILVAIGMQAPPRDKQRLLEKSGVPEMLAYESHLLSREALFLRHMVETQHDVQQMNMGPTGYIFPN